MTGKRKVNMSESKAIDISTLDSTTQTDVGKTLKEAWLIVRKTWVNLLAWTVVWQVVSSVLFMILLAILIVIGWSQLGGEAFSSFGAFLSRWQTWVPLMGWGFVLMMILASVVGLLTSLGQVLIVGSYQQPMELGGVFSRSTKLFVPFFLTSLIVLFLTIGGFSLFIIPGIIISFAMIFWSFEVAFEGVSYMQAIKNSLTMVRQNLGLVIERWAVAVGLSIGWSMLLMLIMGVASIVPGLGLVFQFGGQIASVVFGWFMLAFWYLAYRQVRSKTDFAKPSSTVWMWVVAVMGWILITVMLAAAYTVMKVVLPEIVQSIQDEAESAQQQQDYNWQNQIEWLDESGQKFDMGADIDLQEQQNLEQDLHLQQQIEAELERLRMENSVGSIGIPD